MGDYSNKPGPGLSSSGLEGVLRYLEDVKNDKVDPLYRPPGPPVPPGALVCICCGDTKSCEGFVRVHRGEEELGYLRIECARAAGVQLPPEKHPRLVFRIEPDKP